MKIIWKFALQDIDDQTIKAPEKAQVLSVMVQQNVTCLWMLVDPDLPIRMYDVRIFGTGQQVSLPAKWVFAGSYQLYDGAFVGHVFVA